MGRAEKVTYSQGRKAACEASRDQASARKAAAAKAQASAEEKVAAAWAKHDREAGIYVADPSEANATRVHRARDEAHLLELAATQARREAETTDDAVRTAERALADAEAEEAGIERVKQIEALRDMCSKETYARATAPHYAAIFERHEATKKDTKAIDDFFAASCSASAQLRAMGEIAEDIGPHVMLAPIVEYMITANPGAAVSILGAIECGRWGMFAPGGVERPIGTTFAPQFRSFILDGDWFGRAEHTGSEQERAIAELRAFFAARTDPVNAMRAARMKHVEPNEPTPAAPASPQPLGKTVLKFFSGLTGEMTEIRK